MTFVFVPFVFMGRLFVLDIWPCEAGHIHCELVPFE